MRNWSLGLENVGFGDHFISCAQFFALSGCWRVFSSYARRFSVAARRQTQCADCLADGWQLFANSYVSICQRSVAPKNTCLRFVLQSK
jgi:hypothetical protein